MVKVCPAAKSLVTGTTESGLAGVLLSFTPPVSTVSVPVDATEKGSENSTSAVSDPALATLT